MSWGHRFAHHAATKKAKPTVLDAVPFASAGEAARYVALKDRAHAIEHEGNGSGLAVFRFRLTPEGDWQREAFRLTAPAASKYSAQRATVDGIKFMSRREARRYQVLKQWQRAGHISALELQVPFAITIKGIKVTTYYADFRYQIRDGSGRVVVEDSKGMKTPVYQLKKRLVEAFYGLQIREV